MERFQQLYQGREYVNQMNQLVEYVRQNPDAAYARFLRGYQYLYLGHEEAARKDLERALQLEPNDALARELLGQADGDNPQPAPEELPPQQPLPPRQPPAANDGVDR